MNDIRDDASHASSFSFDTMNLDSPGSRDRRIEDERYVKERVGEVLCLQFDMRRIEAETRDHRDDESVNSLFTLDMNLLSPGSHGSSRQKQEQDSSYRLPRQQAHSVQVVQSEEVQVPHQQPLMESTRSK
jgi:hypothetical protein